MLVLDTHALQWWALDPDRLSDRARASISEMERRGGYASAISIWELGVKIQRGKLEIGLSIDEFARRIDKGGVVQLLPSIPPPGCAASPSSGTIATLPIA